MTLQELRQLARAEYGLPFNFEEDPQFTDLFLNKLINEAHHWFAATTLCYYSPTNQLTSLAAATAGTLATYTIGTTVAVPQERTFRWKLSSGANTTYAHLKHRTFESLLEQYGPLETVAIGTSLYYFLHSGSTDGAGRSFTLVPGPSAAVDVRLAGWVYPVEMTTDSATPELQDAEIYRLIPAICWKMAVAHAGRGRKDARVGEWMKLAMNAAIELQRIIRYGNREPARGPAVGPSLIVDTVERRAPNLAGAA